MTLCGAWPDQALLTVCGDRIALLAYSGGIWASVGQFALLAI